MKPGVLVRVPHPELGGAEDAPLLAGGDADADVAAFLARLGLLLAPAVVIDHAERLVEHGLIVAAVVHVAGRHDVGELVLLDQVQPTHLHRVDAELLASRVDQALDHEIADLGAEAAIGPLLALVGEHGGEIDLDAVDLVGAGHLRHGVAVLADAVLEVGAVVVDHLEPHAQHRAVALQRELGVVEAVGPVGVAARHVVDAVFQILDRPAGGAGERAGERADLVAEELAAEAAAGVGRHDVEPVRIDLERDRDQPTDVVVHRRVGVDRELARAPVVVGGGTHGLDRRAAGARPAQPALDHQIGGGEVLVHRAEINRALECDVGIAAFGMEHGVTGRCHRLFEIDDRRQRIVLDLDQLAGVLGDVAALRHDGGDRLAHVAHLAHGDAVLRRRRTGEVRARPRHLRRLGAGHDAEHAGQRLGLRLVDAHDAGVGMGAAQHRGMRHVGQHYVVRISAGAGEQAGVLHPLHAVPDGEVLGLGLLALTRFGDVMALAGHCPSPCIRSAAACTASTIVW